jgi:hypothetical protein
VHALKDNNAPFQVRYSPVKPAERPRSSAVPEASAPSRTSAPSRNSTLKKIDDQAGVKTYALFVPNLPMDATIEQLEVVFKEFGSIKHDGIQVRSNKVCLRFNFVQFHFELLLLMIFTCYVLFIFYPATRFMLRIRGVRICHFNESCY